MKRSARFSITMPSEAAKNARTYDTKCLSPSARQYTPDKFSFVEVSILYLDNPALYKEL